MMTKEDGADCWIKLAFPKRLERISIKTLLLRLQVMTDFAQALKVAQFIATAGSARDDVIKFNVVG